MEALGTNVSPFLAWLVKTTLQGSLLVCLIMLVKLLLRERLPARWHYCLWLVLLIRLSLPWAPQSRLSIYNLFQPSRRAEPAGTIVQDTDTNVSESSVRDTAGQSRQTPLQTEPTQDASRKKTPHVTSAAPVAAEPSSSAVSRTRARSVPIGMILLVLWLVGAVVLAGYILARNIRLWRAVKRERPVTEQAILDVLEDGKMQVGVQTIVGLVLTDRIKSPALFGFVRPRILLPQGLIEALGLDELRYVFLHELAHLKRRDIHLGWLVSVLQTVHWFNPLIWYAFRRMRADQEMACDALALSRMTPEEPRRYGRAIVSLVERFSQPQYLPSVAGILEDFSQIERRITMIGQYKQRSLRVSIVAAGVFALLAVAGLTDARSAHPDSIDGKVPLSLRRNLLLYYSFDRDGGTRVVDISGMDFHGQAHGAEYAEQGRVGGAMEFDGEDDYIRVAPELSLQAFTVAAWVMTRTAGLNNRRIFMLDQGREYFAFEGNTQGGTAFGIVGGTHDGALGVTEYDWQLEPGQWTHIAVTFSGAEARLYRNGERTETGPLTERRLTGTAYIGGVDAHNGAYWRGRLDELAVFNRALTDGEVQQLYGTTGGRVEPVTPVLDVGVGPRPEPLPQGQDLPQGLARDLLFYYAFDNDESQGAIDLSGRGHHGILRGATYSAPGRRGAALSLDGHDDRVTVPDIRLDTFTFAAWIKTATSGVNNRLIFLLQDGHKFLTVQGNVGSGVGLYLTADVEINEYDWRFEPDRWSCVVATFDGREVRIYIDGRLTEAQEQAVEMLVHGTASIGGPAEWQNDPPWDEGFWEGSMDEVMLFGRALSAQEVAQLYAMTGGPPEPRPKTLPIPQTAEDSAEPVAIWRFDGTAHESVGGKHGIVHGATPTEGLSGQAYFFDGQNDYIEIPGMSLHAFTFSAWVKTATRSMNNRRIFLLDAGAEYCALQGTTRGDVELSGPGFGEDELAPGGGQELDMDRWVHLAATFDGTDFKVYQNKKLARYGRNPRGGMAGTLYIGGTEKYDGGFWHGTIDEVVLFDRALSESDVILLYLYDEYEQAAMPSVSTGVGGFAGRWQGMAVDRPQDGISRDDLTLQLEITSDGRATGTAAGRFVGPAVRSIERAQVRGNRIEFEVRHRTGIRMRIRLELEDGVLEGEGLPVEADPDADRCDIKLGRPGSGRPRPEPRPGSGPRTRESLRLESQARMRELRRLGLACIMFADEHEGSHARDLRELKPYLSEGLLQWTQANVHYTGTGKSLADGPRVALAYDKGLLAQGGGTNVVFNDGHVEFISSQRLKSIGIEITP